MRALRSILVAMVLLAVGAIGVLAQEPTESDGDHGLNQSTVPGVDADPLLRNAYTPELERRTSAIASELRCPVCQGVSVEDSPTELARQMRAVVRDQLAAGQSPDQVRQYFVDKYGEWILLEPKASGFNLVVYILPWLAVLAGLGVIVLAVRRWTRPLAADETAETPMAASTIDS